MVRQFYGRNDASHMNRVQVCDKPLVTACSHSALHLSRVSMVRWDGNTSDVFNSVEYIQCFH